MFQPEMMDFTKSKTFTAKDRHNLVRIDNLRTPGLQDDNLFESEEFSSLKIVGFENHAGRTYLGDGVKPLGKVLAGNGNNGKDGTEGARYKNVFGTYAHGALLPKNPVLADAIISASLERKYGRSIELPPLDDTFETTANKYMLSRLGCE